MTIRTPLAALLLLLSACAALAQTPSISGNEFQTATPGKAAPGMVNMCIGAGNIAAPCPAGSTTTPYTVTQAGSTGTDASANKPTLPNVGANFAASGPYASYVIIATVPPSATRSNVDIENTSGAQIVIVRDDGTAAASSPPVNASVFALAGGSGTGAQGGSWASRTFRGRLQIYSASSSAQVAVMVD